LYLYDREGREIATLSGTDFVTWDGRDSRGEMVSSGVYLAVLKSPGQSARYKLIVSM
jgi:flagellar hook assembly protein FlgD